MRVIETKRFSKALKELLANGLDGRLVADAVQWLVNGKSRIPALKPSEKAPAVAEVFVL